MKSKRKINKKSNKKNNKSQMQLFRKKQIKMKKISLFI